jgi:hypothetical protein
MFSQEKMEGILWEKYFDGRQNMIQLEALHQSVQDTFEEYEPHEIRLRYDEENIEAIPKSFFDQFRYHGDSRNTIEENCRHIIELFQSAKRETREAKKSVQRQVAEEIRDVAVAVDCIVVHVIGRLAGKIHSWNPFAPATAATIAKIERLTQLHRSMIEYVDTSTQSLANKRGRVARYIDNNQLQENRPMGRRCGPVARQQHDTFVITQREDFSSLLSFLINRIALFFQGFFQWRHLDKEKARLIEEIKDLEYARVSTPQMQDLLLPMIEYRYLLLGPGWVRDNVPLFVYALGSERASQLFETLVFRDIESLIREDQGPNGAVSALPIAMRALSHQWPLGCIGSAVLLNNRKLLLLFRHDFEEMGNFCTAIIRHEASVDIESRPWRYEGFWLPFVQSLVGTGIDIPIKSLELLNAARMQALDPFRSTVTMLRQFENQINQEPLSLLISELAGLRYHSIQEKLKEVERLQNTMKKRYLEESLREFRVKFQEGMHDEEIAGPLRAELNLLEHISKNFDQLMLYKKFLLERAEARKHNLDVRAFCDEFFAQFQGDQDIRGRDLAFVTSHIKGELDGICTKAKREELERYLGRFVAIVWAAS